ncbi:hypothetical protein OF377_00105 [Ureaplasma sp. ES3154-GEN]|uniref:hypothetical protein n=1 Tax=Ureaplasma sp. ES3154-GEN TaxID=2984844 RepID=UPI0021E8AB62|nr:hypothetical protein [Ureaplasma sp. ES3154-GEN]MCV3743290.1 hypothetical protein [Ureaplasma sp. ES3154-GEN]
MNEENFKQKEKKRRRRVIAGVVIGSLAAAAIVIAATQLYKPKSNSNTANTELNSLRRTYDALDHFFKNLNIKNMESNEVTTIMNDLANHIDGINGDNDHSFIIQKAKDFLNNNKKIIEPLKLLNELKNKKLANLKTNEEKQKLNYELNRLIEQIFTPDVDSPTVIKEIKTYLSDLEKNGKENTDSKDTVDHNKMINEFDVLKQKAERFNDTITTLPEYNDLSLNLANAIKKYNDIVHPANNTFVPSKDIERAISDLELALIKTKYQKEIHDLQNKQNDDKKEEYHSGDKTTDDILSDYKKQINSMIEFYNAKTTELSNKYQSEHIPNDDVNTVYPKSYAEINNPNNPENTYNKTYKTFLDNQLIFIREQEANLTTTNKEIASKIYESIKQHNLWLLRTNLEEKIESARENIGFIISTLSKEQYPQLIADLTAKLQKLPTTDANTSYMFNGNNSLTELETIFNNLNLVFNALPGQKAKADFKQIVDNDKNILIPSLRGLLDVGTTNAIDSTQNPWVKFLSVEKIEKLKADIETFNETVRQIDDVNFAQIKEKISQFNGVKTEYINAYSQAIGYYANEAHDNLINNTIGNNADLETIVNQIIASANGISAVFEKTLEIKEVYAKIKMLLADLANTPVQMTANLLQIGINSGQLYKDILQQKVANIESEISRTENMFEQIARDITKYYNDFNGSHWKQENGWDLSSFVHAVQTGRGNNTVDENHPNLEVLLNSWEQTTHFNTNKVLISEKLNSIADFFIKEQAFNNHLYEYNKEYIANQVNDELKSKLTDAYVQNQIGYLFGNYNQTSGVAFPYGSDIQNLVGNYGNDHEFADLNKFSGISRAYINDIANLLNNADDIITKEQSQVNDYAYAVFLFKQFKEPANNLVNKQENRSPSWVYKNILSTNAWQSWNEDNNRWVRSLLGETNSTEEHPSVAGYEMLTYMLYGLIEKYKSLYAMKNSNQQVDINYWDDSHTAFKTDLTTIQKAQKIYDIFGINTFRKWNGFRIYASQYHDFVAKKDWNHDQIPLIKDVQIFQTKPTDDGYNMPKDFVVYEVTLGNNDNLTPYRLDQTKKPIPAGIGAMVSKKTWLLNAMINIMDVYQTLFKEMLILNKDVNPNDAYVFQKDLISNLIWTNAQDYQNHITEATNGGGNTINTAVENKKYFENFETEEIGKEEHQFVDINQEYPVYENMRIIDKLKLVSFTNAKISDRFYILGNYKNISIEDPLVENN